MAKLQALEMLRLWPRLELKLQRGGEERETEVKAATEAVVSVVNNHFYKVSPRLQLGPDLVLCVFFAHPSRLFEKSAKSCTKNTPNTTSKLSLRSIGMGALTGVSQKASGRGREGGVWCAGLRQTHNCNCCALGQPGQISRPGHTNFVLGLVLIIMLM